MSLFYAFLRYALYITDILRRHQHLRYPTGKIAGFLPSTAGNFCFPPTDFLQSIKSYVPEPESDIHQTGMYIFPQQEADQKFRHIFSKNPRQMNIIMALYLLLKHVAANIRHYIGLVRIMLQPPEHAEPGYWASNQK